MGAEASATRHLGKGGRKGPALRCGAVAYSLAAGAAATLAAALASALVDSVLAKRILWIAVAVAVAVGAGLWQANRPAMASPPGSDRHPQETRSGFPH